MLNAKKISAIIAAAMAAGAPQAAWACAMCGLPASDHATHAFNTSVLFMMIAPYSVAGAIALGLYIAYRKARSRAAADRQFTLGKDLR
jgi:hypothetical protein